MLFTSKERPRRTVRSFSAHWLTFIAATITKLLNLASLSKNITYKQAKKLNYGNFNQTAGHDIQPTFTILLTLAEGAGGGGVSGLGSSSSGAWSGLSENILSKSIYAQKIKLQIIKTVSSGQLK